MFDSSGLIPSDEIFILGSEGHPGKGVHRKVGTGFYLSPIDCFNTFTLILPTKEVEVK